MKKLCAFAIITSVLTGCSMISSNYIPSSEIQRSSVAVNKIEVYYDQNSVTFEYKEVGRVFLKNINYWADRDPAGQINKIKEEAAQFGADAVIIVKEIRNESSFGMFDRAASGNAGEVFQYSGIAIIRSNNL